MTMFSKTLLVAVLTISQCFHGNRRLPSPRRNYRAAALSGHQPGAGSQRAASPEMGRGPGQLPPASMRRPWRPRSRFRTAFQGSRAFPAGPRERAPASAGSRRMSPPDRMRRTSASSGCSLPITAPIYSTPTWTRSAPEPPSAMEWCSRSPIFPKPNTNTNLRVPRPSSAWAGFFAGDAAEIQGPSTALGMTGFSRVQKSPAQAELGRAPRVRVLLRTGRAGGLPLFYLRRELVVGHRDGVRPSPGFQPHMTSLSSVRCSTSWSRFRFLFCFGSLIDRQICASVRPCQIMGVLAGGSPQLGAPGGRCAPTRLWS